MLLVENDGAEIIDTDYWDSELNRKGFFACSVNAGTFRILAPDYVNMGGAVMSVRQALAEMETGREIIISKGSYKGRQVYEFLFDDHTESPFAIWLDEGVFLGVVPADAEGDVMVSVWYRGPEKLMSNIAKFRVVQQLPCLRPWT